MQQRTLLAIGSEYDDVKELEWALVADCDLLFAKEEATALEFLEEFPVDYVILDLEMEGSWEILRIIRDEDNGWPEVTLIVYMKSVEDFLKSSCIGADYFMSKPLDIQTVLGILEE